jgi:hypothetical protein
MVKTLLQEVGMKHLDSGKYFQQENPDFLQA